MFFLIPFAIAAVSTATTVSTVAIAGGAATAAAVGIKKYADSVEEKNRREVSSARKSAADTVEKCRKNAERKTNNCKAEALASLAENILASDMSESDKLECLEIFSKPVIRGE